MDFEYRFEDEIAAAEPAAAAPAAAEEPDAFARMVGALRKISGYDPGAEDEVHDELAAGRTRRWISRTILFATLTLLVLNAQSLHSWATTLPPGWATETIRELADTWNGRLSMIGLDRPRKAIHDEYESWKGNGEDGGATP
jgi:hypothetical protein